jgi:predicted glycosyltransferase
MVGSVEQPGGLDKAASSTVRTQTLYNKGDHVRSDLQIGWAVPEAPRVIFAIQFIREMQTICQWN